MGFQIRNAPPMVELTQRLHDGAIGTIACGLAYYYCAHIDRPEWPNASPEEKRLRNWVWDRELSGDIIVEQNIHVIDMCNWMLKGHPLKAVGMCDREDSHRCRKLQRQLQRVIYLPEQRANQLRVDAIRPAQL